MSRDIKLLHPKLQEIIPKFLAKCESENLKVLITETFRTKDEQNFLYAKGRTASGSIVTNVRYPNSLHCWGVAFDFCQNIKGKEYSDSAYFANVGKIAKTFGLEWGGDWKNFNDKPHLQLPLKVDNLIAKYGTPTNYIKSWEKEAVEKVETVSEWAKEAWAKATAQKVFDGTDPQGNMTREQLAVILIRLGIIK